MRSTTTHVRVAHGNVRLRAGALLAACALALALLPAATASADTQPRGTDRACPDEPMSDFDDIEGSAHEDNIRCMADRGLTEGTRASGGESYAPRDSVTRDQMASFIARFLEDYLDEELEEGDADRFDDVDSGGTHASNISKLANIEVVEGTSASGGQSYAPRVEVTRDQMAAFIRRALSWLHDGDARNGSAPAAGDTSAFDDTEGSVHEPDVDALAAERVVAGFGGGEYRPRDVVLRDQMASFVMRGYDFAIEAGLDGSGDGEPAPPSDGIEILDPTAEQPHFPLAPGDDLDVTFTTHRAGDYTLEYRDPAPDGGFFLLPGDDEPGPWTDFEGDASGSVEPGEHTVTVSLPADEDDDGVRDLRLVVEYDSTRVEVTETAALIVAEGVVLNLTQETLESSLQDAVDEADDGEELLAIGTFSELVEVSGVDDLSIGALPGTTLEGSIVVEDVDGLLLGELIVTDYETVGDVIPVLLPGDPVGVAVSNGSEVVLAGLTLRGDGEDDRGVVVDVGADVEVRDTTLEGNDLGLLVVDGADASVDGARFVGNATGASIEAAGVSVTASVLEGNDVGLSIVGGTATIEDNVFDDHAEVALDLFSGSADVEGNAFGPDDAEHLCWPDGEYRVDELVADNAFGYDDEPRTREAGDDRTCLGPPEDDPDDAEEGAGEDNGDDGGTDDADGGLLPLP